MQAIGARQGIPYRFLEQIFRDLRRAGLVSGKRGPGGGYLLTRRPEEINLREVVEAIEGPLASLHDEDLASWSASEHRPDFLWRDLSARVAGLLGEIAVSDLCRESVRRSIHRDLPVGLDYQI